MQLYLKGRIAFDYIPKINSEQKFPEQTVERFFKNYLYLRKSDQINNPFPNLNKIYLNYMEIFLEILQKGEDQQLQSIQQINTKVQLTTEISDKDYERYADDVDLNSIIESLLIECPQIPQQNQGNLQTDKRIVIGDQVPKPPPEKQRARPKAPKRTAQLKKGEPIPRPIIWSTDHLKDNPLSDQMVSQKIDQMRQQKPQLSSLNRGVLYYIEPQPILLKEVIYPNIVPNEIISYIEASIVNQKHHNYTQAIKNLEQGQFLWKKIDKNYDVNAKLYFAYSLGQIFEIICQYEIAIHFYNECRQLIEQLPYNNPDRALPFCGFGSAFFAMEEYELALRCFLMAKEFRECFLKEYSSDTATIYNNIAVCYFCISKFEEAYSLFRLSLAIYKHELGHQHIRTITVLENFCKSERHLDNVTLQQKPFWVGYEVKKYQKEKKKKVDNKKKQLIDLIYVQLKVFFVCINTQC